MSVLLLLSLISVVIVVYIGLVDLLRSLPVKPRVVLLRDRSRPEEKREVWWCAN